MGLDVYFRRDIANVLHATACASEGAAELMIELAGEEGERILKAYRQGQRRALVSVALGFGLELVAGDKAPGASPALLFAEIPRRD